MKTLHSQRLSSAAFSLVELIVVVVIVGIVAAFGTTNYAKAIDKASEKDGINQLSSIHAMNETYKQRIGTYYPGTGNNVGIVAINTNLGLSIFANVKYAINCIDEYQCFYERRPSGAAPATWIVRMDQSLLGPTNPCCSFGTCPTLPAC
jgi:prepilin-type N-terminal cleavage/methylation domain-containing protein